MNIDNSKLNRSVVAVLALLVVTLVVLSLALVPGRTGASPSTAASAQHEAATATFRQSASTAEDVPLAGPGEWAQASVEISGAPDDAVVSYVQVKYSVVHSQPSDLEVQLLSSGADVAHTLWTKESAEGEELTRTSGEIGAFRGVPVNGTWFLAVKGGDQGGYIDGFSINVYYETDMPVLRQEGPGTPGQPGLLRLPEGVAPAAPSQDKDPSPDAASEGGSSVAALGAPSGAIIIETQDFEGSFYPPSTPPGWEVLDTSNDGYERYWDDVGCDECGGDWAAWPADRGTDRVDVCAGNDYPNDMYAWMIYGPFDLSDAADAGTDFVLWREIEVANDWVFFGISDNGTSFTGFFWDGSVGCETRSWSYPGWVGDSSVWVAWVFYSDYTITYEGPYVDDIVIWKVPISAPWFDDMESGVDGWTADGFWHRVEDGVSPYPESHSPTHSWWYGQDATGDYDNGAANAGSLTSPAIHNPASLSFWSWYETETGPVFDQRWVQISVDGGPFQNLAQLPGGLMQTWVEHSFDLPPYVGSQVRIRFYFDTVDSTANGYRGWYIDDVAVHEYRIYLPIVLKNYP
jgi:hypothetical protein